MQRRIAGLPVGILCCTVGLGAAVASQAEEPPSRPAMDAPELAALGPHAVGLRTLTLVQAAQLDVAAFDKATQTAPTRDRRLTVEVWYPATHASGATPVTYEAAMDSEPPAPPSKFRIPGLAVRDAKPAPGRHPFVVVSHGYGNVPVAMSWLTENLASKGYVVAGIRHDDQYLNPAGLPHALLRRPLDITFVVGELQRTLADEGLVDVSRTALIGYSMGGYGVLTAGGATLDPTSAIAAMVPGGALSPYVRGGAAQAAMRVDNVKAIVAIAPAGGAFGAWGAAGLAGIRAPLLLIAGDRDLTVPYDSGARAFFDQATRAERYLLTFHGGGHALGLGPAPREMRTSLWNQDWFEDPVWRKDRLIGISLHFVTAFLDRYVRTDASRATYLDGLVEDASEGAWQAPPGTAWGAYSPGGDGVTLWKGFQRRHAENLSLLRAHPVPPR
jgi:predicted dienelactone hydrolase